jgi:hypothetical protein
MAAPPGDTSAANVHGGLSLWSSCQNLAEPSWTTSKIHTTFLGLVGPLTVHVVTGWPVFATEKTTMFGSIKRWIRGVPPGGSEASFQPAKPERRAKEYWREDDLEGDINAMVDAGVLKSWRTDPHGTRWFTAEADAVDWWIEIQQDNTND